MSASIMLSLTFCTLSLLPMMSQPLSLGLVIMFSTFLMCFISSMTLSSWYGYILFLIYVGGLLVMFAYVAALSPNTLFGSTKPIMVFILLLTPMILYINTYPFIDLSSMGNLKDYSSLKFLKMYSTEMVSPQMVSILIGLGTILLITLVVVVKICYYHHASLRPFKT
uniref:NADH-ubiquinone oxidoreductase chain 6 n=1 Tax=Neptuneopsis gilchristi TaxID=2695884 RepID=A0A6B9QEE9_9CAEN|nr:NADH dehydrogenase subunit 6 [Neptuneopsis gilchristi]